MSDWTGQWIRTTFPLIEHCNHKERMKWQIRLTIAGYVRSPLQGAASAAGMAVLPHFLVPDSLKMVHILQEEVCIRRNFYLLTHENIRKVAKIRAVLDLHSQ